MCERTRAKATPRYQINYPCRLRQWLTIGKNPPQLHDQELRGESGSIENWSNKRAAKKAWNPGIIRRLGLLDRLTKGQSPLHGTFSERHPVVKPICPDDLLAMTGHENMTGPTIVTAQFKQTKAVMHWPSAGFWSINRNWWRITSIPLWEIMISNCDRGDERSYESRHYPPHQKLGSGIRACRDSLRNKKHQW